MQNNFFGSKLNSILLLVLIILMIITLCVMFQNKETYLPLFQKEIPVVVDNTQEKIPENIKNSILGNKEDLVSFSIWPNTKVHGIVSYRGIIKGGYFFEASFGTKILDLNRNVLKSSYSITKSDWMNAGPIPFEGNIDFTGLPKGPAYILLAQDDPSGGESGLIPREVLIPIIIE